MPALQRLLRLHKLREAEEQQLQAALASAIRQLHRLESAMRVAHSRATQGRALLHSESATDRIAGREEVAAAERLKRILAAQIHLAERNTEQIRKEFLAKRVQRRQVQALLESALEQDVAAEKRKLQAALDDWHRSLRHMDKFRKVAGAIEDAEP